MDGGPTTEALTFVRTDGDRRVHGTLRAPHTATAPLRVRCDHLHAREGEAEGHRADQAALTPWSDPTVIAPVAPATATLGFWGQGHPAPNPTALPVVFGSSSSLRADLEAPVAAGVSVLP